MPVINGVYTKDFPALGRAPIDADIIPIAEVANQITFKTTIGEIFNAKVFGTTGRLSKFTGANTLGNSILNEIGNAIHLTNGGLSYASFGIINPGTPGDPGVDNDCFIGSTINNDFTIRVNNTEALRIDTLLRLKIANIQNATTDTDKFLVSDGGIVKYRTGAELLSDIGGASAGDLSGYVTLATAQTITGPKIFSNDIRVNTINIGLGGGAVITNTRVGVSALSANTSGDFNTANGYYALLSNTSGNSNTANGTVAIANNTTGNFNTSYGSSSGSINTTGSNNIFLGYNSNGESATESNRTWIGNTDTTSTWLGGNLLLGSRNNATSDKIQVTGSAKITGQLTLGSTITNGTYTYTLPSATGTLALTSDIPSLTNYVTLDTAQTITGAKTLTALLTGTRGSFASSGSDDTLAINHSSGSGIGLSITKGGNGEGLYVNKTSGSGNAATIIGTLNATTLVKSGGTSSQFLKADGSVDSNSYALASSLTGYVTLDTTQTITGVKVFNDFRLQLAAAGTSQPTVLQNSNSISSGSGGYNTLGFNSNSDLFFNDGTSNVAVLSFSNTTTRTYTLPDATGTLALTSNLSAYLPLAGGTLTGALTGTSATFSDVINLASTTNQTKLSWLGYNNAYTKITSDVGFDATYNGTYITNNTNAAGNAQGNTTIPTWSLELASGDSFKIKRSSAGSFTLNTLFNLNGSGNLGLGVTPSAWGSSFRAIQLQDANIFTFLDNGGLQLTSNAFFNGSNFIYQRTAAATYYNMAASGQHQWSTAPSGTAGNAISFTQAMTLGSNSGLSIGTTTAAAANGLLVQGAATFSSTVDILSGNFFRYAGVTGVIGSGTAISGGTAIQLGIRASNEILFAAGGVNERMRITSGGNVGIGTTSPTAKLDVAGKFRVTDDIILAQTNGRIDYDNGVTGALRFYSTSTATERMRITSGGDVGIGTTSPATKLEVNGAIKTSNPTGGTAQPFKVGSVYSTSSVFDGNVLQVEINGVSYDLMIADSPT
jgi:hypothetical protein